MTDTKDIYSNIDKLGKQSALPTDPEADILERVPNPHADTHYVARFTAPEFTSLCPVTGQPDFAHLVIDYVPGNWLVESKSLKLYLGAFRNHGAFHEDCTVAIGKKLAGLLEPRWLRIGGYWASGHQTKASRPIADGGDGAALVQSRALPYLAQPDLANETTKRHQQFFMRPNVSEIGGFVSHDVAGRASVLPVNASLSRLHFD